MLGISCTSNSQDASPQAGGVLTQNRHQASAEGNGHRQVHPHWKKTSVSYVHCGAGSTSVFTENSKEFCTLIPGTFRGNDMEKKNISQNGCETYLVTLTIGLQISM